METLDECAPLYEGQGCWCDDVCGEFGDCCPGCGPQPEGCWCDAGCQEFGDCCLGCCCNSTGGGSWVEQLNCEFRTSIWILDGHEGCPPPGWEPSPPGEPQDGELVVRRMNLLLELIADARDALEP